jgi:hypothetical protein
MIPEVLWTLLCPGANGRSTGEKFYRFLTLPPWLGLSP